MYPGRMRAIEDAVSELKQNSPRGGIDPKALARNDVIILALISKTLLYIVECWATTNCSNANIIPRMNAMGISTHLAPKAKAKCQLSFRGSIRPTQTDANPYINTTTHNLYNRGFLTISSRSFAASSTPITSCITPYKSTDVTPENVPCKEYGLLLASPDQSLGFYCHGLSFRRSYTLTRCIELVFVLESSKEMTIHPGTYRNCANISYRRVRRMGTIDLQGPCSCF